MLCFAATRTKAQRFCFSDIKPREACVLRLCSVLLLHERRPEDSVFLTSNQGRPVELHSRLHQLGSLYSNQRNVNLMNLTLSK